jgi:hypothetical protein
MKHALSHSPAGALVVSTNLFSEKESTAPTDPYEATELTSASRSICSKSLSNASSLFTVMEISNV